MDSSETTKPQAETFHPVGFPEFEVPPWLQSNVLGAPIWQALRIVSTVINNDVANRLYEQPELYKFFRQLARSVDGVSMMLTPPGHGCTSDAANLEHFRRFADHQAALDPLDDTRW